jgi:hypothetical protein
VKKIVRRRLKCFEFTLADKEKKEKRMKRKTSSLSAKTGTCLCDVPPPASHLEVDPDGVLADLGRELLDLGGVERRREHQDLRGNNIVTGI